MSDQVIQILSHETKTGNAKASGKPYSMIICQAVVQDRKTGEVKVGELMMPKDAPAPAPGRYTAEFSVGVDYAKKQVVAMITALVPLKDGAAPAAAQRT